MKWICALMPDYLLDTNILSDLMRHPQGRVTANLERVGENAVCTSIVVVAELKFGVAKSGSKALRTNLDAILSALEVLPLKAPADQRYAEIRTRLESVGKTIGPNDLLIAAHCLAEDLVAVTANTDEFGRVPGLRVENWLAA